jgi:non-homologous end joining protein Ku
MAPRNVASGVALSFGLIATSVDLTSALDRISGTGNVLVCDAGHDPRRITMAKSCPECGEVPAQQLKHARPVEGGLVLLTDEDLAEASADAAGFKKVASVTAHPAPQVEVLTSVGEKMYFLVPQRGHEAPFAALLALVDAHPELAFMTQWTPRSAASQFRLRSFGGTLVFQERTRTGQVREAPVLNLGDNAPLVALAEQFLAMPGMVSDYDPATYADTFRAKLDAIVASKDVIPTSEGAATAAVPVAGVTDLMAKLAQHVAAGTKPANRRGKKVS